MWLIISFKTTTEAMRMETEAKTAGIPGRIIPLPPAISAGCGLAFRAPAENQELVRRFVEEKNICYDQMTEL